MAARIWNLIRKEMIHFARDRMLTTFLFLLPIIQLALLARATGKDIGNLRVAVLDLDRSELTRELISSMENRDELVISYFVDDEQELREMLDWGRAEVGVVFPSGLSQDLANPAVAGQVKVVVNGANSLVGSAGIRTASAVFTDYGQDLLREQGIEVQIGTFSLHIYKAFKENPNCHIHGDMQGSTYAFEHCLALPLYHDLSRGDQEYVVEQLIKAIGDG